MMRNADVSRRTGETDIRITLALDVPDGRDSRIHTGNGFFDHMMELFVFHGGFLLNIECRGDTEVDFHHSAEDIGITLGRAFTDALGDKRGINRYFFIALPMDEALVIAAVDICGRGTLGWGLRLPAEQIGGFDTELACEFFTAFCREFGAAVHLFQLAGTNTHHILEAAFKGFGRALRQAVELGGSGVMSTKGVL